MPTDVVDEPIRTGRTWRDLPPHPPHLVESARTAVAPVDAPPDRPRRRVLRWAVISAVVFVVGFGVGAVLKALVDEVPDDIQASAPTTTLPDVIVPPAPGPDDQVPFPSIPESGGRFTTIDLIDVVDPPQGWLVTSSALESRDDLVRERIVLTGEGGPVVIEAVRPGDTEPAGGGETFEVGDIEATRVVDGDLVVLNWTDGETAITVTAPESLATATLRAIAEAVEVVG